MPSAAHRVYPVSAELLRKGPPHNQLLSRITEYVALCGNVSAATVRLPFDHREHEMRLESLSYLDGDASRRFVLGEMAAQMKEILDQIPGLAPALSQAYENRTDITHLRLVLTPHELALLPFEAANVPVGAPGGAGARLLLQSASPVTLTREVRGMASVDIKWPRKPRVLFAWANMLDGGDVPFERHLLAIRKALSLWLPLFIPPPEASGATNPEDERRHNLRHIGQHLTLLPDATIRDIYEACEKTPYTHVHILAHGIPKDEAAGAKSVGMALRSTSPSERFDLVDGARLANALRFQDKEKGQLPAVVVLATCDSGRQKSVISHGGSIAHDLHVAGIPVVVASQFPLSKDGSVVLASEFYRRLLEGDDPRVAIYYVRRKLFSTFEKYHDWASLVMYACLPQDFDAQMRALQFDVAKRRSDRLLNEADQLIFTLSASDADRSADSGLDRLKAIFTELDTVAVELAARGDDTPDTSGMIASTRKRKAEALFQASRLFHRQGLRELELQYLASSLTALAESRDAYRKAMESNLSVHWVGVQYLSLEVVLRATKGRPDEHFDEAAWAALCYSATAALSSSNATERAYAHASLAELHMLRGITRPAGPDLEDKRKAQDHIRQFTDLAQLGSFPAYSTQRQFHRYVDWWSQPLNPRNVDARLWTYQFPEQLLELL